MNVDMALPSRHRNRNSSPGGLRLSTLSLNHGRSPQYQIFTSERGKTFRFLETWKPEWGSNPRFPILQAGSFNHCTRAPALRRRRKITGGRTMRFLYVHFLTWTRFEGQLKYRCQNSNGLKRAALSGRERFISHFRAYFLWRCLTKG